MATESRTPRAVWKADEAEFFLFSLREGARAPSTNPRLDPLRSFAFYLSAFLNATYSSREILRLEALQDNAISREAFDDWSSKWEGSLSEADARIWRLGREVRRQEVHLRGAETVPVSGIVAVKFPRQLWRGGIYGSIVTGPPPAPTGPLLDDETAAALASVVPLQFATLQHFEVEGERLEAVTLCTRYLALLRQYIDDLSRLIARRR
jgi:hypothetical protein